MDPLVIDPQDVFVDPVAMGFQAPAQVIAAQEQQDEGSADYWRGKHEAAEREKAEAANAYHQSQQALQTVLLAQQQEQQARQRQSAQPQVQQQQQSGGEAKSDWERYLESVGGGGSVSSEGNGTQRQADSSQGLTREEAAAQAQAIAQREIQSTLQSINQDTQIGNQLAHRFQTVDADLIPHSDLVASLYAANPNAPKADRYNYAVQTARRLIQEGRVAAPQQQPGVFPRSPQGGQSWQTSAQQQQGQQYTRIDDALSKSELEAWTEKRRELLQKRSVPY